MIYSVPTADSNELIPFKEIIVVCSKNYTKVHQYSASQNVEVSDVKAGGECIYSRTLKD
jgi:2-C-methyl-D-erythritol 4-phosphate cytidylyltransferase